MDIPINDPGFLGAIVGAVSGLAGAVIGGLLAYVGSNRLERQKAKELSKRLHCLLFEEISGHTSSLARDADSILPMWLHRGNPNIWDSNELLHEVKIQQLNTFCFDNFFEQLIYSPLLVPITNYYRYVKHLNELTQYAYQSGNDSKIDVETMVRNCYLLLEASTHAIDDLLKTKGITTYFTPLIENRVEDYKISKPRYLYLVALARYDFPKLNKWGSLLEQRKIPADLPAIFSEDKGIMLLNYLEQARNPDG
jgi:hypothetical protein